MLTSAIVISPVLRIQTGLQTGLMVGEFGGKKGSAHFLAEAEQGGEGLLFCDFSGYQRDTPVCRA